MKCGEKWKTFGTVITIIYVRPMSKIQRKDDLDLIIKKKT